MRTDIALLIAGEEEFAASPMVQKRGKAFAAGMICGVNMPTHGYLRERAEVETESSTKLFLNPSTGLRRST